jgi:hypothetical protein
MPKQRNKLPSLERQREYQLDEKMSSDGLLGCEARQSRKKPISPNYSDSSPERFGGETTLETAKLLVQTHQNRAPDG